MKMTRRCLSELVIESCPRPDGALSLVRVDGRSCTTSEGVELLVRYEKLRTLCEQACQENWSIQIRTWTASDGEELVELHRDGAWPTVNFTRETPHDAF